MDKWKKTHLSTCESSSSNRKNLHAFVFKCDGALTTSPIVPEDVVYVWTSQLYAGPKPSYWKETFQSLRRNAQATSCDVSMSYFLCKLANCSPVETLFQSVLDPFAGSCSLLTACSVFGSYANYVACDVIYQDRRKLLQAVNSIPRRDAFQQFSVFSLSLQKVESLYFDNAQSDAPVGLKFKECASSISCIVTDPPFGFRQQFAEASSETSSDSSLITPALRNLLELSSRMLSSGQLIVTIHPIMFPASGGKIPSLTERQSKINDLKKEINTLVVPQNGSCNFRLLFAMYWDKCLAPANHNQDTSSSAADVVWFRSVLVIQFQLANERHTVPLEWNSCFDETAMKFKVHHDRKYPNVGIEQHYESINKQPVVFSRWTKYRAITSEKPLSDLSDKESESVLRSVDVWRAAWLNDIVSLETFSSAWSIWKKRNDFALPNVIECSRSKNSLHCCFDLIDEKGNTPLYYACGYGKALVVKFLLEVHCCLNIPDRVNQQSQPVQSITPLMQASRFGHVEVLRLLLDQGVLYFQQDWLSSKLKAFVGLDSMDSELAFCIDCVVRQDVNAHTALKWAAKKGHPHILPLLLQRIHLTLLAKSDDSFIINSVIEDIVDSLKLASQFGRLAEISALSQVMLSPFAEMRYLFVRLPELTQHDWLMDSILVSCQWGHDSALKILLSILEQLKALQLVDQSFVVNVHHKGQEIARVWKRPKCVVLLS